MPIHTPASPLAPEGPPRRFGLLDAMILLAALFLALAWDRPRVLAPLRGVSEPVVHTWWPAEAAASLIAMGFQFLVVASLALFVLRLRPPHPALGGLLRQPGAVACAVASMCSMAVAAAVLGSHLTSGRPLPVAWARAAVDLQPDRLTIVASLIGTAVLMAWLTMAARRQWKPEAGWIDRLGRAVGIGWIIMIPGGVFLPIVRLVGLVFALV